MTSEQVAETGSSDGCQGVDTCICPRATICADNLTSMILLTISRCVAWFDYPLYMLLFLSKTHNLNNFLQKVSWLVVYVHMCNVFVSMWCLGDREKMKMMMKLGCAFCYSSVSKMPKSTLTSHISVSSTDNAWNVYQL